MGIYSKYAEKAYLEAGLLLNKASEDYYKSKMFYGNVQVYIDASNESEAKYFAARAINDFDTFCKCYTPNNGEKLNGIVVKPVGESNVFTACLETVDSKIFESVVIQEGEVKDVAKKVIDKTKVMAAKTKEKVGAAVDKFKDKVNTQKEENNKPEEPKEEEKKETTESARDF